VQSVNAAKVVCRIECSQCGKWRIISYAKMTEAKDADWVCRLLRYAVTTLFSLITIALFTNTTGSKMCFAIQ